MTAVPTSVSVSDARPATPHREPSACVQTPHRTENQLVSCSLLLPAQRPLAGLLVDFLEAAIMPVGQERAELHLARLRSMLRGSQAGKTLAGELDSVVEAVERWSSIERVRDWNELRSYLHATAGAVGRVFVGSQIGSSSRWSADDRAGAMCVALFSGLVMTRWWSRVGADLREHACVRMPLECGISAADLRAWSTQARNPRARRRFMDELRELVRRTWVLLETASELQTHVEPCMGWTLWLARRSALATLASIQRGQYTTLWAPARASRIDLMLLSLRARSGVRLGTNPPIEEPTFPL